MKYKILEQNGVENENVDGAVLNSLSSLGNSGFISGALNDCDVYAPDSFTVEVSTGVLLISGFRVKLVAPYSVRLTPASSPTLFHTVARIKLYSDRSIEFFMESREVSPLIQDDLFKAEMGVYEIEIATFTVHTEGIFNLTKKVLSLPAVKFENTDEGLKEQVSVLEERLIDAEKDIHTLEREVFWLKAGSEGNTYVFDTVRDEAPIRAIPENACSYAVLDRVDGKTLLDVSPAMYANKLNSITVKGKNLYNLADIMVGSIATDSGTSISSPNILRNRTRQRIYGDKTFTVSCATGYDLRHVYFYDQEDAYISFVWMNRVQKYTFTTPTNAASFILAFEVSGDTTAVDRARLETIKSECKVQLEYGGMATAYTPYTEPTTLTIPEDVKALTGYGLSISDTVCNYIDFEKKQYVQMCYGRLYEAGDEDRDDVLSNNIYTFVIAPLDEPKKGDISDLLTFDNIIEVEGGGFIEFDVTVEDVLEFGFDTLTDADAVIPSTITYQLKL